MRKLLFTALLLHALLAVNACRQTVSPSAPSNNNSTIAVPHSKFTGTTPSNSTTNVLWRFEDGDDDLSFLLFEQNYLTIIFAEDYDNSNCPIFDSEQIPCTREGSTITLHNTDSGNDIILQMEIIDGVMTLSGGETITLVATVYTSIEDLRNSYPCQNIIDIPPIGVPTTLPKILTKG
jgi:hypothetical protein